MTKEGKKRNSVFTLSKMLCSWSSVFSAEPQVPDRPPPEELVTRMLMIELTALLKHTEKQHQDRATAQRRRSSCVDYSWLATPRKPSYQLPTREFLELEELCRKIPPSQCGPVILRVRNLVTEFDPDVGEVSHLFRSVLRACLDEEELRADADGPSLRERTQPALRPPHPSALEPPQARRRRPHPGGRGGRRRWRREAHQSEESASD